ncbi:hypothetical protein PG994_008484 [Apiospora phragmitis]|uniref:Uncharacterized protein n=1 Tax=Apiospora phragmitis TaxID=2905665 RepID=A0ABR1UGJ8_9PEZI
MKYWTDGYGAVDDWWFWLRWCRDAFRAEAALLLVGGGVDGDVDNADFVAGVIPKGARLERVMEWGPYCGYK